MDGTAQLGHSAAVSINPEGVELESVKVGGSVEGFRTRANRNERAQKQCRDGKQLSLFPGVLVSSANCFPPVHPHTTFTR